MKSVLSPCYLRGNLHLPLRRYYSRRFTPSTPSLLLAYTNQLGSRRTHERCYGKSHNVYNSTRASNSNENLKESWDSHEQEKREYLRVQQEYLRSIEHEMSPPGTGEFTTMFINPTETNDSSKQFSTSQPSPSTSSMEDNCPPNIVMKQRILHAALHQATIHGFTHAALVAGAQEVLAPSESKTSRPNSSPSPTLIVNTLIPNGPIELVMLHLTTCRTQLPFLVRNTQPQGNFSPDIPTSLPIPPSNTSGQSSWNYVDDETGMASLHRLQRDTQLDDVWNRVRQIMLVRLSLNGPILAHWKQALALLTFPTNTYDSLVEITSLADETLRLADAPQLDLSWYLQRAAVSAVYAAADLYTSQIYQETCNRQHTQTGVLTSNEFLSSSLALESARFLSDRLREISKLERSTSHFFHYTTFVGRSFINTLRSGSMRI